MRRLFLIAARNLAQHTRRTVLLGGAIACVCALFVLLGALTDGIRETMMRSATTLMTGHVNVAGFYKVSAGQSAPVVTEYAKVLEVVRREVPELDYVVARGRGWSKLVSETASSQVGVSGIDVAKEPALKGLLHVVEGSLSELAMPGTALIFEAQARRLGVGVGDLLTISTTTPRGATNTSDVRVAAVARDMGLLSTWTIYVPNQTLREMYQLNDGTTGALQLYLKNMKAIPRVETRLRAALAKAGFRVMDADPQPFWMKFQSVNREDWTGQKLDVTSWEEEVSFMTWIFKALAALTWLLVVVLLVIIAVGIMNTMWIAIRERTREIGTLRAIGMQRPGVMALFVLEAFQLGLGGTLVGALGAAVTAATLNGVGVRVPVAVQVFLMRDTLWLWFRAGNALFAVVFITFFTVAASIYPAWRAAALRPVTAMHHVG